jgi:hypothetical protein
MEMDMKIAITPANAAKIEAALKVINRDFVAHTFSTFDQIAREADNAEAAVLKLINKGDAPGAYYVTVSGDAVPNAYRYARSGTKVVLDRGSKGWFLVELRVVPVYQAGGPEWLVLTPAQDAKAIERLRKAYRVD